MDLTAGGTHRNQVPTSGKKIRVKTLVVSFAEQIESSCGARQIKCVDEHLNTRGIAEDRVMRLSSSNGDNM